MSQLQSHASESEPLPRSLIFFAALWLLCSGVLVFGLRAPVQPSSTTFTPSVLLLLLCVTVGLMIGWPLLRMSQRAVRHPLRQTLLDVLVLVLIVQVALWMLRLVTSWSVSRTVAIDATMTGWLLLAAAMVGSACGVERAGPRSLAMLACVGMCLLGPAAAWVGLASGVAGDDAIELVSLSPLMAVHTLGEGGATPPTDEQWRWIALLYVAAGAAWAALTVTRLLAKRSGRSIETAAADGAEAGT